MSDPPAPHDVPTVDDRAGRRRWAPAVICALLAIAGCASPSTPVTGQITDQSITLSAASAQANTWFELTNTGANPCDLVVIVTQLPPDQLPIVNGMVQLDALGAGTVVDSVDSAVQPGTLARWQEQLPTDPGSVVSGVRIILCNGPGDYQAGRYAISLISPV